MSMRRFRHTPKIDERGIDVALLAKVERRIRTHPENYDQGVYFTSRASQSGDNIDEVMATREPTGPMCGTKACVAGTALMLAGRIDDFVSRRSGYLDWDMGGRVVLGISPELSDWLFSAIRSEAAMPYVLAAIRKGETDTDVLEDIEDEHRLGRNPAR